MKASQIVGLVLGLIVIVLALMAYLTGSIDIGTQTGAISLMAAIFLGIMVILSSMKQKTPQMAPTAMQPSTACPRCGTGVQPEFVACPRCGMALPGGDLPPPPPDYVPPPGEQRAQVAKKPVSKQQTAAIAVVVVVVIVIVFFMFSGSMLGLGAKWTGTAKYYTLNIYGERDSVVNGEIQMTLKLSGTTASGTIDITPLTQVDVGSPGYTPEPEEHFRFSGDYDGSSQVLFYTEMTFGPDAGTAKEQWKFTITGNSMVGQVTNMDTYAYIGLDSDTGAFVLTK